MPSPRGRKPARERSLLNSWRQQGPSGARAKLWLIARRATATLLVLALVGWLTYVIFSPMWLPKTFFVFVCADEVRPLSAPPIEFLYEDYAGFTGLRAALTPLEQREEAPALASARLGDSEALDDALDNVAKSTIGDRDALILYVAAHGVVWDDKAYLMCGNFDAAAFDPDADGEGLYAVSDLLTRLDELPGATKLLLLDAGRTDYQPRLGMAVHTFTDALEKEVKAVDAPSVWVLSANAPLQKSHVSPALRRSVFGYMASLGLQGAADLDDDGTVQLDELSDFVQYNVSRWVEETTARNETQTPVLLGARLASVERPHLLFTANLPNPGASVEVGADLDAAKSRRSERGAVGAVSEFLKARVDEFGVDQATSMYAAAESVLLGDGDDDEGGAGEGEGAAPPSETAPKAATEQDELELIEKAWMRTADVDKLSPHPLEYAPDLWRRHTDRLLWLESLQQCGERDGQSWLVSELRSVTHSLEELAKPDAPLPAEPQNVVDLIRQRRPSPPLRVTAAPTLALAEAVAAADPGESLPPGVAEFVDSYDAWLRSSEGVESLSAIIDDARDAQFGRYREFELLTDLIAHPDASLETVKLALESRRLAEQVGADLLWGQGWAVDATDEADNLRLEAERLLLTKAASDWQEQANSNLKKARSLYLTAQDQLAQVREATRVRSELLADARDYLRWARHDPRVCERVAELFRQLGDLHARLESPGAARLADVQTSLNNLQRTRDALGAAFSSGALSGLTETDDGWGMRARLSAALLAPADRLTCLTQAAEAERGRMAEFVVQRPTDWSVLRTQGAGDQPKAVALLEAELQLLREFAPANLDVPKWPDSFDPKDPELASLQEVSESLGVQLSRLPAAIAQESGDVVDELAEAPGRPKALERLKRAALALHLVDAADSDPKGVEEIGLVDVGGGRTLGVTGVLHAAAWYDLLRAGRDRLRSAEKDASANQSEGGAPSELASLRREGARLGELASSIRPKQPPLVDPPLAGLSLEAQQEHVDLVAPSNAKVEFVVRSRSSGDTPVWIVAQYDERLIEVRGDDFDVYPERMVRRARVQGAPTSSAYPYQPGSRGLQPSLSLASGRSQEFSVSVSRRSAAGGDTTLVLKAIGGSDHLRVQVPVQLPGRQDLQLLVHDGQRELPERNGRYQLYPNRVQDLTLQVANKTGRTKTVAANLYVPQRAGPSIIPSGTLDNSAARRLLAPFGTTLTLATMEGLELPADGSPCEIEFDLESPKNRLLLGAAAGGSAGPAAPGAETPSKPNGVALPHGLLLELVDESNNRTIRWIQFEVRRPRSFLTARATYDPGQRRQLRLTVAPKDAEEMPAGDVRVELEIDSDYLSPQRSRRDAVTLRAPNFSGALWAPLAEEYPSDIPAYLHVDGYPRAFEFRVPRDRIVRELAPTDETLAIRIASPRDGEEFAKQDFVPARVEVDAPPGALDEPGAAVVVGVDLDVDRELSGEEAIVLPTDRQVDIYAQPPVAGGTLALNPRIGDFNVDLPTSGIVRMVNVYSKITTSGQSAEDYVSIALDGAPPTLLSGVQTRQEGEKLIVECHWEDRLTSVEACEVKFDVTDAKPQQAKQTDGGRWVAELSTAEMPSGDYTLLLSAKDAVGNVSDPVTRRVTIESTTSTPAARTGPPRDGGAPKVVKNRVSGAVTYGRNRVEKVTVTLEGGAGAKLTARVSDDGRFDFGPVAPGTYTLRAKAFSRNGWRSYDQQITVSDKPNTPISGMPVRVR